MNIFQSQADAFERQMRDIVLTYEEYPEILHGKMIELMCEMLEDFGCIEGVKIFKETEMRYG